MARAKARRQKRCSAGAERHLTADQVKSLWEASSFLMQQHGLCLNARLTLRYELLGIDSPKAAGAFLSQLIQELQALIVGRTRDVLAAPFHRLFVHEADAMGSILTRMVMHVPRQAGDIELWLRGQFFPHQLKADYLSAAWSYRHYVPSDEQVFDRHLRLMQFLVGGVHPRVKVPGLRGAPGANPPQLAAILKIDRRLQRSIGVKWGAARYGISESIGGKKQAAAAGVDLPCRSPFEERTWAALTNGWELHDHAYRQHLSEERRQLEAEVASNYPGDQRRMAAFLHEWARSLNQREVERPNWRVRSINMSNELKRAYLDFDPHVTSIKN